MPTKKVVTKKPVRKTTATRKPASRLTKSTKPTATRTTRKQPARVGRLKRLLTGGFEGRRIMFILAGSSLVLVLGFAGFALYTKMNASASSDVTTTTSLTKVISNAGSAKTLTLASGTYTMTDFAQFLDPTYNGAILPTTMTSFTGAGSTKTNLYMIANTSTKKSLVPTASGSINNLYDLTFNQESAMTIGGFSLTATAQGHYYNGIRLYKLASPKLSDIKVTSMPGYDNEPPGETYGINDYKLTNAVYSSIEIDGGNVGASGLGSNGSTNTTVKNSYFHRNYYSAGATFYKDTNVTVTGTKSSGNRTNLNFEEDDGTITLTNDTFGTANKGDDIYVGNTTTSAKFVINNPVLSGGQAKLRIHIPATYHSVTNKQKQSDVKVYVNGVDKTSSVATIYQS